MYEGKAPPIPLAGLFFARETRNKQEIEHLSGQKKRPNTVK